MGKDKLKVLTVNVSDSSGGAARAAYRIHRAVCNAGVEGQFLVKHKQLIDPQVIALQSFDSHQNLKAPFRWLQHKIKNKLQQARWRPYPQREDVFMSDLRGVSLHGALQKLDYDVLHLHWINLRFVDIRDLAKITKPIVWTLHDCWPFTGICHYFYDCTRYTDSCGCCPHLHSSDAKDLSYQAWKTKLSVFSQLNIQVVCPSNWLADAARSSSILGQFPVSVIPNPIDSDYFSPGSKTEACRYLNLDPSKSYILYGAMNAVNDKNKGFAEFKTSMQHFEASYPTQNLEILVFGSADEANLELKHIPQRSLGMLNDEQLLAAYRASAVMVVPSLSENLSNIIMESLSCGTPVVGFNIGGNSDMIVHQHNGYLARKLDTQDMAAGIHFCLHNDELSVAARNKVLDCFNAKLVGQKYMSVYETSMTAKADAKEDEKHSTFAE